MDTFRPPSVSRAPQHDQARVVVAVVGYLGAGGNGNGGGGG